MSKIENVKVVGEELAKPSYWVGRQWAVTAYGVEARDGTYVIEKTRLWEENQGHGWLEHMLEKPWVDLEDFKQALAFARKIFEGQHGCEK